MNLVTDKKLGLNPSTSLGGSLKKKWIIDENNVRRLVKGNYGIGCRQSISEVFATEIHKRQNKVNYSPYTLISISYNNQTVIGCENPCFTDINTEFISAIDIVNSSKKSNNMNYYEFFILMCNQNGIDIRPFLEYQILTDFIITNTDRHFNNFGIIRDSKTLKWLTYAPLFDSGNSLFYKLGYIPVDKALLDIDVTSFCKKEVQLLKLVKNRGLVDVRLLPTDNELYNLLSVDSEIKEEVNERIVKAYLKKIEYLVEFQNGADIWKYNNKYSK